MADSVASTAFGPMVIVALEQLIPPTQRIIEDPIAYQMLPFSMKMMVNLCKPDFMRSGFVKVLEKTTPGIYTGMVCRKRYVEDLVRTSLPQIDALVILGAGLDTLAYRIPALASLNIYEVDLLENIQYKQKTITARFGDVPSHVKLVPIDFETQPLEMVLQNAGYTFAQRTLFIWEGVTQYLTESAVHKTLEVMAKAKGGSRLVFTYVLKDFIEGNNLYESAALYQRFRVKDQVWLYGMHPGAISALLDPYGWSVIEDVGKEELIERYVTPVGRTGTIAEIERCMFAEKRID